MLNVLSPDDYRMCGFCGQGNSEDSDSAYDASDGDV